MYKLIASSFDKTLINDYEEIPSSTILLLDELRRKGIIFVIATGRFYKSVLYYNKDFPFIDYLISLNGSYIYDVNNNRVIFKKNIGIRTIKKIIKLYYDKSIIYLIDNNNCNLISKDKIDDYDDYIVVTNKDIFLEENKNNIYKIELYFDCINNAKTVLEEIILLNLPIKANLQFRYKKYLIEITNSIVDKYKGLEIIMNKLDIKNDDVIAFGSDLSDIELIKNVGCGVAVMNACNKLKEVASDSTFSNNEIGVESYLKNK